MNYYDQNNWDEHLPTTCEECGHALNSNNYCDSQVCFEVDMM